MSFLDAYSRYHQILLFGPDQERSAFITTMGLYYYRVMPFGLKNAGATYQRLVTNMFREEIEKSMKVYVDNMLVKSRKDAGHISDLGKTFDIPKHYKMKLNTSKCTFEVSVSKFLGFIVNCRWIEANSKKIEALQNLKPPINLKELQTLTCMIASLNRFISKCSNRCQPFLKALKKSRVFILDEECDRALADLKSYLSNPPLISIPKPNEQLFVYMSSSKKAVSAALIKEDEKVQKPIYYINRILVGTKVNYLPLETCTCSHHGFQ